MPTEILPYLWIGDYKDCMDINFLHNQHIETIVNCTKEVQFLDDPEFRDIKRIRIPVDDRPSVSYADDNMIMYHSVYDVVTTIHNNIINESAVLVHCQAGKQRSATVIACYLIRYGKVDVATAIQYIRSKRPKCFRPSNNFELALNKFYNHLKTSEKL